MVSVLSRLPYVAQHDLLKVHPGWRKCRVSRFLVAEQQSTAYMHRSFIQSSIGGHRLFPCLGEGHFLNRTDIFPSGEPFDWPGLLNHTKNFSVLGPIFFPFHSYQLLPFGYPDDHGHRYQELSLALPLGGQYNLSFLPHFTTSLSQ